MKNSAIFDLDGTLVDSMGYWSNVDKQYLQKRNIKQTENVLHDIEEGNSFLEVAQHFKEKFKLQDSITEILEEWTDLVAANYQNDVRLKPGVKEFLDLLKENSFKIGLGTSNSMKLASLALKTNGVYGYFDALVTGCREIKGKPYPDIFLTAAAKLGEKPQKCFVCEDTLVGVQAAKKAGMQVLAVKDDFSEHDAAQIKREADFYGQNFYQIIDYCKQNGLLS